MRNKKTVTALVVGVAIVSIAAGIVQELRQDFGAPIGLIEPFSTYVTVYDENNVEAMRPDIFGTHGVIATGNYAATMIGIEEFTRHPFEIARKANPDATLLINDYITDAKFEKVIRSLENGGKPLYDTIGIQSHMHGGPWPHSRTWSVCERFAKFGVPLHFTETTVVSGPKKDGKWQAWR